jgi:regulator of nonsense transcripts 1
MRKKVTFSLYFNNQCRQAPMEKINQLEEQRKTNPKIKFEEITKKDMQQKILKEVQLTYVDSRHYLSVFKPLILIEEDYDKKIKES